MIFAGIDLGSNSFHLCVKTHEHNQWHTLHERKIRVRLAAELCQQTALSDQALARIFSALDIFANDLQAWPQARVRAVGTSALRRAANGETIAQALRARYGWPLDIISGTEEARLIYRGVTAAMQAPVPALVIDVGGGSTEFIFGDGDRAVAMTSVDVGCLTAAHQFFDDGKISPDSVRQARYDIATHFMDVAHQFRWLPWTHVIGCSGCIEALLDINKALGHSQDALSAWQLDEIEALVCQYQHSDDLALPGIEDERKQLIPAAVAIYGALFELFAISEIRYSNAALKDGIVQELFDSAALHITRQESVHKFARQYHLDHNRVDRIRSQWQNLSVQMAQYWPTRPEHQELAELSISLFDIGRSVSAHNYQIHSTYLLEHAELAGFDRNQHSQLVLLVSSHVGKISDTWFAHFPVKTHVELWRVVRLLRLAVILANVTESQPDIRLWATGNTLYCAWRQNQLPPWINSLLEKELAYQQALGWPTVAQIDLQLDKN